MPPAPGVQVTEVAAHAPIQGDPATSKTPSPNLPPTTTTPPTPSSGQTGTGVQSSTTSGSGDPLRPRPGGVDPLSLSQQRRIVLLGGQASVDVLHTPLLGSPNAPSVVVEMFDYTCHHCRDLHQQMKQARERYGKQLAVVLLVNPMNKSCNRYVQVDQPAHREACHYARLSLAVWNTAPEEFAGYHEWLMEPKEVPSVEEARDQAAKLISVAGLNAALADKTIARQIEANGEIYHLAKHGPIPKLMNEKFVASGPLKDAAQLFEVLEKFADVRPLPGY